MADNRSLDDIRRVLSELQNEVERLARAFAVRAESTAREAGAIARGAEQHATVVADAIRANPTTATLLTSAMLIGFAGGFLCGRSSMPRDR